MKISYNTLKNLKKDLKSPEDLAQDLIMHTAEVEEIIYEGKNFENMVIGSIEKIENHPDADKLKVCFVNIGKEQTQIVCGGTNLNLDQKVAVAKIGASVIWHGEGEPVVMKKVKIRGIESNGMICASEEIGLKNEFPAKNSTEILDLSHINAKNGTYLAEILKKNEIILDIDNKAINHRPDLFSHIGILREICTISGEKFNYKYEDKDFSGLKDLGIKNNIPEYVKRYIGLKVKGVSNINTSEHIKKVLNSSGIQSKGLLVDISNYSLYFYGQPTHIFDADKIEGNIEIRFAKSGEKILALDNKEYKLTTKDIIIADNKNILAIAGIIGAKNSAVSDFTKNIIIESANFNHAILRASGKRLGIRTDALNIFEKDLLPVGAKWGISLIISELKKVFPEIKLEEYSDIYIEKQKNIEIDFDLDYINKLIGKKYDEKKAKIILENLGIIIKDNKLIIPAWRKDLNFKSDIAEEIARIDGYDKIEAKVPDIQLGAVIQSNIYKTKQLSRGFFVENGFFDMYTYSFVNEKIMNKCNSSVNGLIPLKNSLSEESTHMKNSLIPNLLLSLEKNRKYFKDLKLFETEKVFKLENDKVIEEYSLSGLISKKSDNLYYETQNLIRKFLETINLNNYQFKKIKQNLTYSHSQRTADIIVRGQTIGKIGEIKEKVTKNFSLKNRIGFFEINLDKLSSMIGYTIKATEISDFQESSFDISFAVKKDFNGKLLQTTIQKISPKIIKKVDLFDIYENENKLPGQRSLSFKIYLQDFEKEITDKQKNDIINKIIIKLEKLGAKHK